MKLLFFFNDLHGSDKSVVLDSFSQKAVVGWYTFQPAYPLLFIINNWMNLANLSDPDPSPHSNTLATLLGVFYFFFPCTLLMILPSRSAASGLTRRPSASCPSGTTQVVFHHLNRLLTVWTKIDHLCSRHCHVGCHTTCVWLFTPPRLPSCSLNIDSLPCWLRRCWPLGRPKYSEQCNNSFFPHI